jgi:hypothetical protein
VNLCQYQAAYEIATVKTISRRLRDKDSNIRENESEVNGLNIKFYSISSTQKQKKVMTEFRMHRRAVSIITFIWCRITTEMCIFNTHTGLLQVSPYSSYSQEGSTVNLILWYEKICTVIYLQHQTGHLK